MWGNCFYAQPIIPFDHHTKCMRFYYFAFFMPKKRRKFPTPVHHRFLQHFKCITSPDTYCVIKLLNIWIFHHILLFPFVDAVNYVATGCKRMKSPNICCLKSQKFPLMIFPEQKRNSFQRAGRCYWSVPTIWEFWLENHPKRNLECIQQATVQ